MLTDDVGADRDLRPEEQSSPRSQGLPLDTLRALSQRSDASGALRLGLHLSALVFTGVFIWLAIGTVWIVPALMANGVVLVALFAPLHETIHRTAFRSRRLNAAVAGFCGFLLLLPPRYFRAFHLAHHRYTQDKERDPELAVAKPGSLGQYLWQVSGIPYWMERTRTLSRHAGGRVTEAFIAPQERPAIVAEARCFLGLYAIVALFGLSLGAVWIGLYWLVPAALGQPALRLFLLAEHTGCPQVPDMRHNTRTTSSNALVRGLTWNMPYHSEHHIYPGLPFHALPKAHDCLAPQIEVQAPGYVAVHRAILASFRSRTASDLEIKRKRLR